MTKEKLYTEIEIGNLLVRCPDENGDFFIKIRGSRSMSINAVDIEDVIKFLKAHIKEQK